MTALLDTTVLSNFANVQRPELLQQLFGETAVIPPAIQIELRQGEILGRIPRVNWLWLRVIELTEAESLLATQYESRVHRGEAECLAVALTRRCGFVSDDRLARRLAKQGNILVSGTLGGLLELVEGQYLTLAEADQLLLTMIDYGYRSPVQSLRELKP